MKGFPLGFVLPVVSFGTRKKPMTSGHRRVKRSFFKSLCYVIFVVAVFRGYKGKERKTRGAVVFTYENLF